MYLFKLEFSPDICPGVRFHRHSYPLTTINLFSISIILSCWECYINGIICESLDWLFSFETPLRSSWDVLFIVQWPFIDFLPPSSNESMLIFLWRVTPPPLLVRSPRAPNGGHITKTCPQIPLSVRGKGQKWRQVLYSLQYTMLSLLVVMVQRNRVKIIKFWHKIWKAFSEEKILGLSPEGWVIFF